MVYYLQKGTRDNSQSSATLNKTSKGLLLKKLTHIHTGKTIQHVEVYAFLTMFKFKVI